jgi:hypothetical protein
MQERGEPVPAVEIDPDKNRLEEERQADDPAGAMKRGKSRPSSKLMIVPEAAPTANRTANTFDQRSASARQTGSPVRRCIPSAMRIIRGSPTPSTAKNR